MVDLLFIEPPEGGELAVIYINHNHGYRLSL
jgi:hypothetical protein